MKEGTNTVTLVMSLKVMLASMVKKRKKKNNVDVHTTKWEKYSQIK